MLHRVPKVVKGQRKSDQICSKPMIEGEIIDSHIADALQLELGRDRNDDSSAAE